MMTGAAGLEKIFEKYKFIEPVPANIRENLLKSRERILKSTLREAGDYSIWYALVLFILLKSRKLGIKLSIGVAKVIAITISVIACAVVIGGGYLAVQYLNTGLNNTINEKENRESEAVYTDINDSNNANIEKEKTVNNQDTAPVYEISLYNGRTYRGIIKSRGQDYVINTAGGEIKIPGKQIRLIKRTK